MTDPYSKPPLTETAIGFALEQPLYPAQIDKLVKALRKRFVATIPLRHINVHFDEGTGDVSAKMIERGWRLGSFDQTRVVLVSHEFITISQMAPYPGWNLMMDWVRSEWKIIGEAINNRRLKHVSLRSINRIDVPFSDNDQEAVDIADYLLVAVFTPNAVGQSYENYSLRTESYTDSGNLVVVHSGSAEAPLLDHASFILDIDVKGKDSVSTYEDVWPQLDALRVLKNEIFEQSITDKSRALFR
jgi:uncharacterized protein (TIGR04255 family)